MGAQRLEFAGRSDEPEWSGGQPQLVGSQPAQALAVGREPHGASAGYQSGARVVGAGRHGALEGLKGLDGDRVGGGHHEVWMQPLDDL